MSKNLSWKMLSEETIIKDPWIDLRASTCLLPTGLTISPFYVNSFDGFFSGCSSDTRSRAKSDFSAPIPSWGGEGIAGVAGRLH